MGKADVMFFVFGAECAFPPMWKADCFGRYDIVGAQLSTES